jgi:hypothetical protein
MRLGKDALCSTLISTLVANDLFLTGHKMRRKGMTSNPSGRQRGNAPGLQKLKSSTQIASEVLLCDGQVTSQEYTQQFTE